MARLLMRHPTYVLVHDVSRTGRHLKLSARLVRDLQAHSRLSGADYEILVALTDAPDGRQRFQDLARTVEWEQSRAACPTRSPG
jgi:hypothetical protein